MVYRPKARLNLIYLEAKKVGEQIRLLRDYLPNSSICLNIGSSDTSHLEAQPYIDDFIYKQLRDWGITQINVDNKVALGVNLVADLADSNSRMKMRQVNADLIMANNILEHLISAKEGIRWLAEITPTSKILIISGPQLYPFHPDPIDNRFRPSLKRLKTLLKNDFEVVHLESFFGGSVLVANEQKENRKRSYEWLRSRFYRNEIVSNPRVAFRGLIHAIYPTRCYLAVLKRKPSVETGET